MAKEMLINVSQGEECRIALVEDGKLEELYMERTSSAMHVGNIYKGIVTNVEASIQAAFINFGLERNGFLHITDLMPTYFGQRGDEMKESVGRKMARRDRPPIQRCLRRGDEIVVQVIKEGIGTKGPTLSSYLSIPGRILVMMPGMSKMGVSKKIEDEEERRRLRTILDGLKPPKDVGFIIRTAGIGKSKAEIQRDFTYLTRLWLQIEKTRESGPGPMELYTEGDLVTRTVRDVFSTDVDRIIVDNKDVAKRVKDVIKIAAPRTRNKVELHEELVPLFHKYNIERDIELMYSRHVPLPSGGSLVIDSTEAVVAIDVNSGKMREHADAETTAFKTDMEAADEIPRQLRLRDLGGVIICDFIDLRFERHRRDLENRLHENFKNDRAKTKVLRMSQFGIIEMTRQRMRPSLKRSIYNDCPHCKGAGLVKTPESMSLDVMRRLAIAVHDQRVVRVELLVHPEATIYLQNRKRSAVAALEHESNKRIVIRPDGGLGLDEINLQLFDVRDGRVYLAELGMFPEQPAGRHAHPRGRGGSQQGRRYQGRGPQQPPRSTERSDEPDELERGEDEADEREEARDSRDDRPPGRPPSSRPPLNRPPPASYSNYTDTDVDVEEDDAEAPSGNTIQPGPRPQPGTSGPPSGEFGEGGPRRRRRRGGRGRNRNRNLAPQEGPSFAPQGDIDRSDDQPPHEPPAPSPEHEDIDSDGPMPDSNERPAAEPTGPRRRRRRGGRGRGRRSKASANNLDNNGQDAKPTATPAEIADSVPPVRGSTDRHHLIVDEDVQEDPVLPPPTTRRPPTFRELDEIPDDFD